MGALSVIPESFAKVSALQAEKASALVNIDELSKSASQEQANAAAALRRGALQAGLLRARGEQVAAAQRVALANANVDLASGTAADVQQNAAVMSELDAATAQNNARAEALGHKTAARRYQQEADRLDKRYRSGGFFGGTADDEAMGQLALSALGAAASFGMGGK